MTSASVTVPASTPSPAASGGGLRAALVDAVSVVGGGFRLVWRHLPTLLALYLIGAAARGATIWFAVELSTTQPFLAQLILPIAPIASLTAIVFMLRTLNPSLRFADFAPATSQPGEGRLRRIRAGVSARLNLLASVLIPFLTVYAASGFLESDRREYINTIAVAQFSESADWFYGGPTVDRFQIGSTAFLLGVIIVAFVLRRLINRFDLAEKSTAMGLFAGYVEVFWMVALARYAAGLVGRFDEWRDSRVFTHWFTEQWAGLVDLLGPIGPPVQAVVGWFGALLSQTTDLVVLPIAWLTVGAVVLGRKEVSAASDYDLGASVGSAVGAAPEGGRWRHRIDAARTRAARVPSPVRRVGRRFLDDFVDRFSGLARGVRVLFRAGFVPMLLFCLVFMVARGVEWLAAEGLRQLRGPVEPSVGIALAPWFDLVTTAMYTCLLVGLLAAAIDRIVRRTPAPVETAPISH